MRILILILFLTSCAGSSQDDARFSYAGAIDKQFVSELRKLDGKPATLTVTLSGGKVETAIEAAELALANDWDIEISVACYSACSEIFIHGFDEVTLLPQAVLGFHGNSRFKNALYREVTDDQSSMCFLQYEEARERLMAKSGANKD